MIKTIQSDGYKIQVGDILKSSFDHFLNEEYQDAKKVIVVDENTHEHCLNYLVTNFKSLSTAEIILIPAGEDNKVLEICVQVWEAFMNYDINRNDLVINLGGGMITDIGGFIASVYKRGVDFINIPTSLLGMVDASTGGKTGIDFNGYKNLIGTFANPVLVVVDIVFLKTLPDEEFVAGKAEVLKHGIITSRGHWNKIKTITPISITEDDVLHSIEIKNNLVLQDCNEKNIRKKLNTGHTIGHALESFLLIREKESHGVCVAWGLLTEAYLSLNEGFLEQDDYEEIKHVITSCFPKLPLEEKDIKEIINMMKQDKKNESIAINFNLIKGFGDIQINYTFSEKAIHDAIKNVLCHS